jgi:hypothetical protein
MAKVGTGDEAVLCICSYLDAAREAEKHRADLAISFWEQTNRRLTADLIGLRAKVRSLTADTPEARWVRGQVLDLLSADDDEEAVVL